MRIRRNVVRSATTPSILVASGLGAVAVGSAFAMAVAARTLPEDEFAAYTTWWTSANLLGLTFAVVEGYLPRLLISHRSAGSTDAGVVAAFTRGSGLAVGVLVVVIVITGPMTGDLLFAGNDELVWLVAAYVLALSMQSLQRGVAIGRNRFDVFPSQLGADGVTRAVGASIVGALGATSPVPFAGVVCFAAFLGVVVGGGRNRRWCNWRAEPSHIDARPIGLLLVASLGPLVVSNVAVPWLAAEGTVAPTLIGAMGGAILLSRLPTLMVGAVYGPALLPLSQAVERGNRLEFQRLHRIAWLLVVASGVAFVGVFTLLGPFALRLLLGPGFEVPSLVLALLATSSALLFLAVLEQAALVALTAWHRVALGWSVGLVTMGMVLLAPVDPLLRIGVAITAAPAVAAAVMAANRRRLTGVVFSRQGSGAS